MKISELKSAMPKSPGVYHFLDEGGKVLYVGKAKNLKNRIKQYFLKELGRGPAIEQMVRFAKDIKWIETESEIEAVILEAELIKKLKPKYNVRAKDDKSFLMIKISKTKAVIPVKTGIQNNKLLDHRISFDYAQNLSRIKDESKNAKEAFRQSGNTTILQYDNFPLVELVRFKEVDLSDKSADYFGPYPAGELLKKSLRYLRKIFPYRDCSKTKFRLCQKKSRPCLYGDIRICPSPCAGYVDQKEYLRSVVFLKKFLRGKKGEIIQSLEKEMADHSKNRRFEEAANVRNQLAALNHIKDVALGIRDDFFSPNINEFKRIECYDISNISKDYVVGSMVVFTDGKPDKDEYRKFKVKSQTRLPACRQTWPDGQESKVKNRELPNNDLERLNQVLLRRFRNDWQKPNLILVDGGALQLKVAKDVLSEYNLNIPIVSISKGPERKRNDFHFGSLELANFIGNNRLLKNVLISARDEAHRFAISYYRKLHRKGIYK